MMMFLLQELKHNSDFSDLNFRVQGEALPSPPNFFVMMRSIITKKLQTTSRNSNEDTTKTNYIYIQQINL